MLEKSDIQPGSRFSLKEKLWSQDIVYGMTDGILSTQWIHSDISLNQGKLFYHRAYRQCIDINLFCNKRHVLQFSY